MSPRSIKAPAGKGSVSVRSVAADAAELRARREGIGSGKPVAKKRTPNAAFMKSMTPSAALAAIIGDEPVPRTEVNAKVWEYIKKNGLQDKARNTMINADAKLKDIFKKASVSMFEMTKLIDNHLK